MGSIVCNCEFFFKRKLSEDEVFSLNLFYENLISNLNSEDIKIIRRAVIYATEDNDTFDMRLLFETDRLLGIGFKFDINEWSNNTGLLLDMQKDLLLAINRFRDGKLDIYHTCNEHPYNVGKVLSDKSFHPDFRTLPDLFRFDFGNGSFPFSYH